MPPLHAIVVAAVLVFTFGSLFTWALVHGARKVRDWQDEQAAIDYDRVYGDLARARRVREARP